MNDIEYDKVGIIRSIGGLQRINRNLLKILKEENITIKDLIIKAESYCEDEELLKMSYPQLKDFHGLLIADFRYLKDVFDREVFFKNLDNIEGIS